MVHRTKNSLAHNMGHNAEFPSRAAPAGQAKAHRCIGRMQHELVLHTLQQFLDCRGRCLQP